MESCFSSEIRFLENDYFIFCVDFILVSERKQAQWSHLVRMTTLPKGMECMQWNAVVATHSYYTSTVSFILTHARILIERNLEPPFFEGARTVPLTCLIVYITH